MRKKRSFLGNWKRKSNTRHYINLSFVVFKRRCIRCGLSRIQYPWSNTTSTLKCFRIFNGRSNCIKPFSTISKSVDSCWVRNIIHINDVVIAHTFRNNHPIVLSWIICFKFFRLFNCTCIKEKVRILKNWLICIKYIHT